MTADVPETVDQEKLLKDFKERLQKMVEENQQMEEMTLVVDILKQNM